MNYYASAKPVMGFTFTNIKISQKLVICLRLRIYLIEQYNTRPTLYAFEKHDNVESYLIDSENTSVLLIEQKNYKCILNDYNSFWFKEYHTTKNIYIQLKSMKLS